MNVQHIVEKAFKNIFMAQTIPSSKLWSVEFNLLKTKENSIYQDVERDVWNGMQ